MIVVVGDVIDDGVVRPIGPISPGSDIPARIMTSPGGSGANQAAWLGWLGIDVRFAGRAGAADVVRHARALHRYGVDARLAADPVTPTGTIIVMVDPDGQRDMYTDRGANLNLSAVDLPDELLTDATHLHISGYALFHPRTRVALFDLVRRSYEAGISLSVDPASAPFLRGTAFLEWTEGFELIFPNLAEGRALTGLAVPGNIADRLLDHYQMVALKLGADGALAAGRDGERLHMPARPADVVDTTGAGDAFCAGFLAAWSQGRATKACLESALDTAAEAIVRPGARPPLPPEPRDTPSR